MVSIHDTHEFHNYINSPPPLPEFKIHPNTILDYLKSNHETQYNLIKDNKSVVQSLNNVHLKFTLFLPMINEEFAFKDYIYRRVVDMSTDFKDYIYRGVVDMSTDFKVTSMNGKPIKKLKNTVNNKQILVKDIKLRNGSIHIIKNKF